MKCWIYCYVYVRVLYILARLSNGYNVCGRCSTGTAGGWTLPAVQEAERVEPATMLPHTIVLGGTV